MALLLEVPSEFSDSVKVSYWKIGETNIDWWRQDAKVILYGFVDEAARRGNKSAMLTKLVQFPSARFPFKLDDTLNPVARAYTQLKTGEHEVVEPVIDEKGEPVLDEVTLEPTTKAVMVKDFPEWVGAVDC